MNFHGSSIANWLSFKAQDSYSSDNSILASLLKLDSKVMNVTRTSITFLEKQIEIVTKIVESLATSLKKKYY